MNSMIILRILPPKFVRKANQWQVTWFTHDPKSTKHESKQNQRWFSTEEEAKHFIPEA